MQPYSNTEGALTQVTTTTNRKVSQPRKNRATSNGLHLDDLLSLNAGAFTAVPTCVIRHYSAVGISNTELVLIINFASMPHNIPLRLVASQMGITPQKLKTLLSSLLAKKMVTRSRSMGQPPVYNFKALVKACLAAQAKQRANVTHRSRK